MNVSRSILRAQRSIRVPRTRINTRHYATETTSRPAVSGAVSGGLVGGVTALGIAYGWYHFSGAKTAVQTAHQAKSYVDQAVNFAKLQLPDKTPSTSDALQILHDTANRYAAFIPGAQGYVDSAFKDIEAIRKHHGEEVDNIVREAYSDLRKVSSKGLSFETAGDAVDVLANHLARLYSIAGDAAEDILDGHPQLKEKLGGSTEQIKKFSERYGQEAKKQVEDVREQIRDIVKSGLSLETVQKIQKLVQDKTEEAKKMGENLLSRGSEEMKPLLDSNPKIKQLVQDNMDAFKNGNIAEVIDVVHKAVSSGDTKPLEEYIKKAAGKK